MSFNTFASFFASRWRGDADFRADWREYMLKNKRAKSIYHAEREPDNPVLRARLTRYYRRHFGE